MTTIVTTAKAIKVVTQRQFGTGCQVHYRKAEAFEAAGEANEPGDFEGLGV